MTHSANLSRWRFPAIMLVLIAAGLAPPAASFASAESTTPIGLWETVSDVTGEATGTVRITLEDSGLVGRIERLIRQPGEDPDPLCTKCPGEKKDQPIQGMTILWDLEKDGEEWNGGYVLDPDDGRTYRSELRVTDDNEKLEVRGYIGFSLFGRTQVWNRRE